METERLVFGVILQFHLLGYFDSDPYFLAYLFYQFLTYQYVLFGWLCRRGQDESFGYS